MPNLEFLRRQEIARLLNDDLQSAYDKHVATLAHLNALTDQSDHAAIPTEAVLTAAGEFHLSLEEYVRALKRYTEFTIYKILPEGFSRSPSHDE